MTTLLEVTLLVMLVFSLVLYNPQGTVTSPPTVSLKFGRCPTQISFAFYRCVKMRVQSETSDRLHMWMNSCIFNRRPVGSPPCYKGGAQVSRFRSWHPLYIVTTTAAFEKAVWSSQRVMFRNRPALQIPSHFCISLFHGPSRKGKKDIKTVWFFFSSSNNHETGMDLLQLTNQVFINIYFTVRSQYKKRRHPSRPAQLQWNLPMNDAPCSQKYHFIFHLWNDHFPPD